MAVANVLGRNRASASLPNMDHFNLVSSPSQATLLSDDVVVIESESERNGEFKRFVKLKKSHWVDAKQRRACKLCLADFGSKNKKLNCRRFFFTFSYFKYSSLKSKVWLGGGEFAHFVELNLTSSLYSI